SLYALSAPSAPIRVQFGLFLFLLLPPPPRPPLFPYTTLFRSPLPVHGRATPAKRPHAVDHLLPFRHRLVAQRRQVRDQPQIPEQDRKSTRLNSSHGSISYAVFCLKKKKNTYQHTKTPQQI